MKKVLLTSVLIGALALQGCATGNMNPPGSAASAGIGALAGAAAGAIIGSTTGSDKVGRDAAIGAAMFGTTKWKNNARRWKLPLPVQALT